MKINTPLPLARILPGFVFLLITGFSVAFVALPQASPGGVQAAAADPGAHVPVPDEGREAAAGAASGAASPPPVRPETCTDGRDPGPIRVQIGAVEAITYIGQVMPLPVKVKGVCNLGGFKLWLTYNHSVTRLVDVQPAPFLAGDPPVNIQFVGLRPGSPYQTITARRPPGTGGVDGVGTLAKLFFEGMAEGYSDINLVRIFLYDADGNEMETDLHPVRLTVIPTRPVPGDPRLERPSNPGTP